MFWGGQAVRIVLGAVIGPKFVNMPNTLPLSANVETVDLVCFFIFAIILGRVKTILMTFLTLLILYQPPCSGSGLRSSSCRSGSAFTLSR